MCITPATPEEQAAADARRKQREEEQKLARAKSATRLDDARTELNGLLKQYAATFIAATVRMSDSDSYQYLEVERGWATGCTLNVQFDNFRDLSSRVTEVREDGSTTDYYFCKPVVQVSWSATGRSVEAAAAAVDIYTRMVAIARELDSFFSRRDIVSVYTHKA